MKQYFEKIKNVESVSTKTGSMALDKVAAGRFIKHGLAGNTTYSFNLAEQNEKTKIGAHIKFEQVSKKRKMEDDQGATQALPSLVSSISSSDSGQSPTDATAPEPCARPVVKERKTKRGKDSKREGKKQQSHVERRAPDTLG